mmetsp:Transcript_25027/g.69862  ORF Transcript_25027/g.69862 Transcript_25027/m.69862 type:complete len:305 (-) Transcript_25027:337-1251(-)|eukprot:CAMPEP_0117662054 /NCGR_PEP_ID=MMETSP0804-20121206/7856_1 /TAXON_ID=1074897 /ORGANISM="Tetraselmis astigmatica, Strain CCMP880" /LENGTH=304 /DNA_ID=CAMNT_0005468943 /DNA_START=94 /DNA_END=1008 /DNA_ORIENTATION=+
MAVTTLAAGGATYAPRAVARLTASAHHRATSAAAARPFKTAGLFTSGWRPRQAPRPSQRRSTRSRFILAAWGAEVEWEEASVIDVSKASSLIWSVKLDVGDIAGGYVKPGQFIQAKVGDSKPGFFAIASPPTEDNNLKGVLELLVKEQGGTAELLCKMAAGDKLEVSPVMGKGFPIENLPTAECPCVALFATGSGISPVKALIESGSLEADKRSSVTLYFGAADEEAMACKESFPMWKKLGIKVVPVLSSAGNGYVQDAFSAAGGVTDGSGTGIVLCGQKEMAMAVTEIATEAGVPKQRILTNF